MPSAEDLNVMVNGTDLRKFITTDQPLCRGSGGGTRPPVGGLGGTPPILVFPSFSKARLNSP
jgi:hypothetical protein